MLFCVSKCRSITFIMYNFDRVFYMYIFILQTRDDAILKEFIILVSGNTLLLWLYFLYTAVVAEVPGFGW